VPGTAVAEETPVPGTAVGFAEEVTVTATRDPRAVTEVPAAVAVVGERALAASRAEGLDAYFDAVPGVVAQPSDGASDVKLAIRGFGARAGFGVRDLLVLVDGVPITDADGFTRLDQIDLAAAERLEVVKGPASALYGNAAFGGVLNVITRRGAIGAPSARLRLEAGELGFAKGLASVAGGSERGSLAYALHLSESRLDGFREHNDTETRRANGTLEWFGDGRTTVTALLNVSRMRDEIPGTLDRDRLERDPSQVRPVFELFDHRRDDDRRRLGLTVERQLGSTSTLEARLFGLTRDLDHPIFQVLVSDADRLLAGVRWAWQPRPPGRAQRLTLGVDGDRETSDNQRYANAFGSRGRLLFDAGQEVESLGLYAQDEITVAESVSLTVGARYDRIRFALDDRLRQPRDLSAERTFERASPKLGLLWRPRADLGIYLNLATGFQVPTTSELTATGGVSGFNEELRPQRARHAEVGLRGSPGDRVRVELALFQTDVHDEILPRTVVNEQTVFGNVGRTRHRGAELGLEVSLAGPLEARLAYGLSDNELVELGAFRGNTLPGVPERRGSVIVATRREGLNARLGYERVGPTFLDDANTRRQEGYGLLSAGLTYERGRLSLFLHGSNLTHERYAAWIAVNDPFGNYFAPAPGRAITGGIDVRF
jgi:iron complex outermembrane receptor protein